MKISYEEGTPDAGKLMRCEVDRVIVTKRNVEDHPGHTMKIVNYITPWEWVLWKLGRLK